MNFSDSNNLKSLQNSDGTYNLSQGSKPSNVSKGVSYWFNQFIKTIFDYNKIFYIVSILCISIWVLYNVLNLAFDVILGISTIAEFIYYYFNLKEELTEGIVGLFGFIGFCVLYLAMCNSCYMEEFYMKNIEKNNPKPPPPRMKKPPPPPSNNKRRR
jgi:hypothetical protein